MRNIKSQKINAAITFLINGEESTIEIYDKDSCITFVEIKLTAEQLSSALSRLAYTDCESCEINGLEHVGKIQERKTLKFKVPPEIINKWLDPSYKEMLGEYSQKILDEENEGWISSKYFDSQNSTYWENDEKWAQCQAYRWVEKNNK